VIGADIATITCATNKGIRVEGLPDWLLAVDFHAGHDAVELLPKMLLNNAAMGNRFRRPSVLQSLESLAPKYDKCPQTLPIIIPVAQRPAPAGKLGRSKAAEVNR
jgi:hypothetical protein